MPLDRAVIEQQLAALGEPAQWWERREMRDLPSAMNADERILAIATGKLQRARFQREWLIVVTSQRLICLQTGKRMGRRQLDLHASEITDVNERVRVFRTRLVVRAYGEVYRLKVRRPDARKLITALAQLVQPRERPATVRRTPAAVAQRVIQHMLDLPGAALDNTRPALPAPTAFDPGPLERRLQLLEDEVQRLQQQVDFLEDLLQQRSLVRQPEAQSASRR